MTQQLRNEMTASLFRQLYLARMMNKEHEYFLKFPLASGIKNVLKRMKDNYHVSLSQLKAYLPKSKDKLDNELALSDEKLNALCNIFEKLSMLDEQQVVELESTFDEMITVKY